jgi:hypothetical protein
MSECPVKDDYSLARKIRSRSAVDGGRIPIVALGGGCTNRRSSALRVGFTAHIANPDEPQEHVVVIADVIAQLALP